MRSLSTVGVFLLLSGLISSHSAARDPLVRRRKVLFVPENDSRTIPDAKDESWILLQEHAFRYLTGSQSLSFSMSMSMSMSMAVESGPSPEDTPGRADVAPTSAPVVTGPPVEPASTPSPVAPPVEPLALPPTTPRDDIEPEATDCFVSAAVDCTIAPGSVPCDQVGNTDIQCHEHPTLLSFVYSGGSCSQSTSRQGATFFCQDHNGGLAAASEVYVVAMVNEDAVYFEGYVKPGDEVTAYDGGNGLSKVGSFLVINIFSSEETSATTRLQSLMIRASCEYPLRISEQFGGLQFASYRDGMGATYPRMTLGHQVTNTSPSSTAKVTWIETETNFGLGILVLGESDSVTLQPDEQKSFAVDTEINLLKQSEYTITTTVDAETVGGDYCSAVVTTTFTI